MLIPTSCTPGIDHFSREFTVRGITFLTYRRDDHLECYGDSLVFDARQVHWVHNKADDTSCCTSMCAYDALARMAGVFDVLSVERRPPDPPPMTGRSTMQRKYGQT